ncbi:unnamed protein product [Closterium sp. NIES-65]|nr:unnamed protein product [Closterium sp. NIES-65]
MAYGCPFAVASNTAPRGAAGCPVFLLVGAAICTAFTGLQEVVPAGWLQQLLVLRFFSAARVGDRPWRDVVALTVAAVATQVLAAATPPNNTLVLHVLCSSPSARPPSARPLLHVHVCTSSSARPHLLVHICTSTSARPHLHVHVCTSTSARPHLHPHICTSTSARPHLHIHVCAPRTQACGMTVAYAGMYAVEPTAHTLASMLLVACDVLPMTTVLLLPCLADSLFRFTYRRSPHLHPLVFPLVSTSIWTLLSLLSPIGATAHPLYSVRSILPLVQATAWVGMDGVLLLLAWLVGGIHQVMWEEDAVGRGVEGWRSCGGGRVVGKETEGRGGGVVRCRGDGGGEREGEGGYSQLCGEGCNGGSAVRDGGGAGGEREGSGRGGGRGGRDEGEGAGGESRGRGAGSGRGHVQVSAALLVVLMAAGSAREAVFSSSFFQNPLAETLVPSVSVSCILSQACTNTMPPQPPSSLAQSTQRAASAEAAGARQLLQGEEGEIGGELGKVGEGDAEGEVSAAEGARAEGDAETEAAKSAAAVAAGAAAREAWEKWQAWRMAGISRMVQQTQQRARAGEVLILWSEAAVILLNDHEEAKLLADLAAIATAASANRTAAAAASSRPAANADLSVLGPYIGASYMKLISPEQFTNSFALIGPTGAPMLRYNKSHPVPSVEGDVLPGDGTLPVVDTPLGRLSVAICFDLQFPALISQAGRQGVDILLQPSWTWGAIGHVTFETDAVRAAENGLTLLRCSSIGVSGVVSPYYRTLAAQEVLDTGVLTMHSSPLPLPSSPSPSAAVFPTPSARCCLTLCVWLDSGRRGMDRE